MSSRTLCVLLILLKRSRYIIKSVNQYPRKLVANWKPEAGYNDVGLTELKRGTLYSAVPPLVLFKYIRIPPQNGFRYSSSNGELSWRQMFPAFQPSGLCLLHIEKFHSHVSIKKLFSRTLRKKHSYNLWYYCFDINNDKIRRENICNRTYVCTNNYLKIKINLTNINLTNYLTEYNNFREIIYKNFQIIIFQYIRWFF